MKTRTKILAVAGSAVLAVALLSGFSQGSCPRGERNPERVKQFITWRMDDTLEGVEATDAQKQAIHALKDGLFEQGLALHEGQQAVRTELLTQWESATPDAQRVHQLVDERVEAFRALAHRAADAALETHRILTPEQRQELATQVRERAGQR